MLDTRTIVNSMNLSRTLVGVIACRPFSRSSSVSCTALTIHLSPSKGSIFGRSLSFILVMSGKKAGQSSMDKLKQKTVQVWKPVSTEHTLEGVKCDSSIPIEDTVKYEESTDESIGSNTIIQQANVISKFYGDSEIVNRAEKHSVSILVDAPLIRFVKGKWGLTQKQIEKETCVKIIFPSAKGDSSIVIEGASQQNVSRATEKITNILEQALESPDLDYSHFISLPLAFHPELAEKLHSFQKSILEEDGEIPLEKVDDSQLSEGPNVTALGIDSSIFIKPQTFHLTVLMLKLWTNDRVATATEILKGISSKVIDALENRPVSIRLRGLACMRGSPAKAYVLYAPVEEVGGEGRLLRACQVIIDAFVEAGLVSQKDAHHSLKLHATLMNARYRKRKKWTKTQDYFDARGIFDRYGSEDWGEYLIQEAHLSQRFAFDESGYYHCCGSIPFPGCINN